MKRLPVLFLLVGLVLLVGCGASQMSESAVAPSDVMMEDAFVEEAGASMDSSNVAQSMYGEEVTRMIIRNADLSLVVVDTEAAQADIEALAAELEGYILNSERYAQDSGQYNIDIVLRVPVATFNTAMSRLRGMAVEVTRDSVNSEDVTEQYVDLQSRLSALEVKAERLEDLMQEAEDTEAVLEVYRELSATQQEIESVKGRMQYLEKSSSMATISVHLRPDEVTGPIEVGRWEPSGTVKSALETLLNTLKFLVDALIWIVIYILPVLLVIGLVIFGIIRLFRWVFPRRSRQRKAAQQAASDATTPPAE